MGKIASIALPLAALAGGAYFLAPALFGTAAAGTAADASFLFPGTAGLSFTSGASIPGLIGTAGAASLPTWVSPALTLAGGGISALGSVQQANALKAAGLADQNAANAQAAVMEQNAGQARAQSQRAALEERRRGNLILSKAQAAGAASGTTGVGLDDLYSDIAGESEYRYLTALASGESAAQGLEYGAQVRRATGAASADAGDIQSDAAYLKGFSTLGSSIGNTLAGSGGRTLFEKYGN